MLQQQQNNSYITKIDNFNFYGIVFLTLFVWIFLFAGNINEPIYFLVTFYLIPIIFFVLSIFIRINKINIRPNIYDHIIILFLSILLSYFTYFLSLIKPTGSTTGHGNSCFEGISALFISMEINLVSPLLLLISVLALIGLFTYKLKRFHRFISYAMAIMLVLSFVFIAYHWFEIIIYDKKYGFCNSSVPMVKIID